MNALKESVKVVIMKNELLKKEMKYLNTNVMIVIMNLIVFIVSLIMFIFSLIMIMN